MRKLFFICLLSLFVLFGCTENNPLDTVYDYINDNDGKVFTFFDSFKDTSKLNKFEVINDFSPSQFDSTYNLIIVDVSQYHSQLNETNITQLYHSLEANSKIIVVFWEAKDYSFIKNTPFSEGEKNYSNSSQMLFYYNFDVRGGILSGGKSVYSPQGSDISNCLHLFADKIKSHRGSL